MANKGIIKQANECGQWMIEATEIGEDDTIESLKEDSGDIFEVDVILHLINGDKITLRNKCRDSVLYGRYVGDTLYYDEKDDVVFCSYNDDNEVFHQMYIAPEHIIAIDGKSKDVDWKKVIIEKKLYGIIK